MIYIVYVLAFFILLSGNVFSQDIRDGSLSGSDVVKYKLFLKEQRSNDIGNVETQSYSDDRNTKVRKLQESINYQEKESRIAREQARDERMKEREDIKIAREKRINELVDKGVSAKTNEEANRYYKGARELKEPTAKTKKSIGVSIR